MSKDHTAWWCQGCCEKYWALEPMPDDCADCRAANSKRPSARAEPQPRTWSYEDIRAAFERDREGL